MGKKYATTKKDFERFKRECRGWINVFGLKGWEFTFLHDRCVDEEDTAMCQYSWQNRYVFLMLNKVWLNPVSALEIRRAAFHEVCELLFVRLGELAEERFIEKRELKEEVHNLVRTFENAFFDLGDLGN